VGADVIAVAVAVALAALCFVSSVQIRRGCDWMTRGWATPFLRGSIGSSLFGSFEAIAPCGRIPTTSSAASQRSAIGYLTVSVACSAKGHRTEKEWLGK
jgi:hypothetical protein